MPGPASSPVIQTLFSEIPQDVDELVRQTTQLIGHEDDLAREYLELVLDAAQSGSRLNARLASNEVEASQVERQVLRAVAKVRREVLDKPGQSLTNSQQELDVMLRALVSLTRSFPTTPLKRAWPSGTGSPRLLHSVYRTGDMLVSLQFLLQNARGTMTLLYAHLDYAHVKLVEILRRTNPHLRLLCAEDRFELIKHFQTVASATSIAPKLHCRMAAGRNFSIVSSADMNAESYTTHIEIGMLSRIPQRRLDQFVEIIWSHGVPFSSYSKGLSQDNFRTTHAMIYRGLQTLQGQSFEALVRDIQGETHRILTYHDSSGYVESDKQLGLMFVNLKSQDISPSVRDEITNVCNMQFGESTSVLPIETVVTATERDGYVAEVARRGRPLTVFYLGGGSPENVASVARRIRELARYENSNVTCVGCALGPDGGVVYGQPDLAPTTPQDYLALIHYGMLVGVSRVFSFEDAEKQTLWRLFTIPHQTEQPRAPSSGRGGPSRHS